jgi:glycosyltransferase involved in cell wall biosynthesis
MTNVPYMPAVSKSISAVIFSRDRPLQLDAALRSLERHCTDFPLLAVTVLYMTSSSYQEALYQELHLEHPQVLFRRERSFKRDVRALIGVTPFIGFIVDDTLFVRDFSIQAAIDELRADDLALGFSLRLGTNATHCYPLNVPQELPEFATRPGGILAYHWPGANHDFGYPLELSSSVYRSSDLEPLVHQLPFSNPNTMEAQLAATAAVLATGKPRLLCFRRSAAFSVPANLVQDVAPNRAGGRPDQSSDALAAIFEHGGRIDTRWYDDFPNNACHQEVQLHVGEPDPPRPAVSVIIPCYRQAQFLEDAVASVIAQTWTDWEIVVIDDGSTDETAQTARGLIERYPQHRIYLLRQQNQGLARARNNGIGFSTGRYILPLDADDMIMPRMLELTVTLLESDRSVSIAYTDMQQFGSVTRRLDAGVWAIDTLVTSNQLNYCSLYRRGVWAATDGYNPNMRRGYEDWDFWIASAEMGFRAKRIAEAFFLYRVRPGTMYSESVRHHAELLRQISLNHPALFTPTRRLGRYVRHTWRTAAGRAKSLYRRLRRGGTRRRRRLLRLRRLTHTLPRRAARTGPKRAARRA